ncbi:MAG: hypothetical protein JNM17_38960 [Archangium sp.]|nr:hypothetical protein [Archangium sp.]
MLIACVLVAPAAHAAACCLSVSVVGTGRLTAWEAGAAGINSSFSRATGRWTSSGTWRSFEGTLLEDELRFEAWGIVRLADAWQLSARVPWVVGFRAAGDERSVGTGPGDVSAAIRWEAIPLGTYLHVPGFAFTLGVAGPTGRRPEQSTDALGASVTGRGVFAGSFGVTVEETWSPWFARLDAGVLVAAPFRRVDTGATQWLGPALQAALSGGREVWREKLVLALSVRAEHELAYSLDGVAMSGTAATTFGASASAAWKVNSHWTVTAAFTADAFGLNRETRLAGTLGVRHGFF